MVDKDIIKKLRQTLTRKDSLYLLVDQKARGKSGSFIRFFGSLASFPIVGVSVAMEQKATVIYFFSRRIIPGLVKVDMQCGLNLHLTRTTDMKNEDLRYQNHRLVESEIFEKHLISEKNIFAAREIAAFAHWTEERIRKYPTQWCWDYAKWSRKVEITNSASPIPESCPEFQNSSLPS